MIQIPQTTFYTLSCIILFEAYFTLSSDIYFMIKALKKPFHRLIQGLQVFPLNSITPAPPLCFLQNCYGSFFLHHYSFHTLSLMIHYIKIYEYTLSHYKVWSSYDDVMRMLRNEGLEYL